MCEEHAADQVSHATRLEGARGLEIFELEEDTAGGFGSA